MQLFTIVSGQYIHGAAALLNSLHFHKFDGEIVIAHTGDLDWQLSVAAPVKTVSLNGLAMWPGNAKAGLLLNNASGEFAFLDADCIINSDSLFEIVASSISNAPIFCVEGILPYSDHRRNAWRNAYSKLFARDTQRVRIDQYYNSGFLAGSVKREIKLLEEWAALIGILSGFGALYEDSRFPMSDQDCLNAILQNDEMDFVSISPPDVWYAASPLSVYFHIGSSDRPLLLHCTGNEKPWSRLTVPGRPPNVYERQWRHFSFEYTPWARSAPAVPRSVSEWLKGSFEGRVYQRLARFAPRITDRLGDGLSF